MNGPVNSSQMWNHMKKLKGQRKYNPINAIEDDQGRIESDPQKITEMIAEHFWKVSSNTNLSPEFLAYKEQIENNQLEEIEEDTLNEYNSEITYDEMIQAIQQTKSTAVGPDNISYQMIKRLPNVGLMALLKLYNMYGPKENTQLFGKRQK